MATIPMCNGHKDTTLNIFEEFVGQARDIINNEIISYLDIFSIGNLVLASHSLSQVIRLKLHTYDWELIWDMSDFRSLEIGCINVPKFYDKLIRMVCCNFDQDICHFICFCDEQRNLRCESSIFPTIFIDINTFDDNALKIINYFNNCGEFNNAEKCDNVAQHFIQASDKFILWALDKMSSLYLRPAILDLLFKDESINYELLSKIIKKDKDYFAENRLDEFIEKLDYCDQRAADLFVDIIKNPDDIDIDDIKQQIFEELICNITKKNYDFIDNFFELAGVNNDFIDSWDLFESFLDDRMNIPLNAIPLIKKYFSGNLRKKLIYYIKFSNL